MTYNGSLQITLFFLVLLALVKPLGDYMVNVYEGATTGLVGFLRPLERLMYRLCGVQPVDEMDWKTYGMAMLMFSAAGMVALYALQRFQSLLPLNPHGFNAVDPALAFNNAASYVTNTNWQAYSGETTMSHLTNMLGMTVQNFVSAATGMAILIAMIRGFVRRNAETIGNFWVDLIRGTLYILLPLAVVSSLLLVSQGAVQTLTGAVPVRLLQPIIYDRTITGPDGRQVLDETGRAKTETVTVTEQIVAVGPAATQVISRGLGTSGGGFFNANSAHPFESSTPASDFLLLLVQTMIAAGLTYTFGKMVGDTRQGWAVIGAMLITLLLFMLVAYQAESAGNPQIAALGVDVTGSDLQPGGNMEGKEVRFGIARTALVATATTGTSTGAANGMHDSLMPLGGMVTLVMMQVGEVILGGVGSGLSGMLVFVIIAVFIAGLMVGRTPEYLGKKIEPYEMKMASLVILVMPIVVMGFTAVAVVSDVGTASIFNPGPHGFSEVLYAYTSMANNNGSTFGGLNANTLFYNFTGGLAMLVGRFWTVIPTLALAGSLARKKTVHTGEGALPTHTPLFVLWLVVILLGVGALTFLPALALGPIVEHLLLMS